MRNPVLIALGGLLALAAAMGIGRFVYTPILPFMVEEMSLSSGNAGLIASANFLGYLVGALAASMGFLPGSRRLWFLGALLLSALTTAAMGMTILIDGFLALRFVGGVASAFVLVFSSALILERLNEAGRPGLSSIHFAGVGCGIAISSIAVAVLAANGMGWRALWIVSGLLTLLCLVIAAFLIPDEGKGRPAVTSQIAPPGRISARLVRLIVGYGLFGFGYVITATFVSVITRDNPALNPAEPYVWLIAGLAAAPSVYLWVRTANRIGGANALCTACIIEACAVVLTVVADTPAMILVASALFGLTFMGITALGLIEAHKLAPHASRQTLAIMTASFGLGQVIGPWFAGLLHSSTGSYEIASFIAAGTLVITATLVRR